MTEQYNELTNDQLLSEWAQVKNHLDHYKAMENDLRKLVVNRFYDVDTDAEGTKTAPLGNGWKLKAVFKQNRYLSNKDGQLEEVLDKIESQYEDGKFIAERLVSWKPSLVLGEYKKLPVEIKEMVDDVMTQSAGAPTLTLVEPKK